MKIKRVVIKNFRSIKHVDFEPQNICVFVGENNAGKTNILSAINFLLGEYFPSKRGITQSDYYNEDISNEIFIGVEFLPNHSGIEKVWCNIPWDDKQENKVKYFANDKTYYLSSDARDACSVVYLDAERSLESHLRNSKWTIFGRITRLLDEDFRANYSERHNTLHQHFQNSLLVLNTQLYSKFENDFRNSFGEQIKRTKYKITLDFKSFDPLNYYRSIHPILSEHGRDKDPSEAGQGMRNLILLALFRAYAKVFKDDAIVAVEEPEIYLHPHARRSLKSLFDELVEQGQQVFYTTHSTEFINVEQFDTICLVEKRLMKVEIFLPK